MAQNQSVAASIVESEALTIYTPSAASENPTKDLEKNGDTQSSTPWPGRNFIIRSRTTGRVVTLLDGQIILDKPGGLGTFRWRCVEKKGWMGFQDPASAMYLGYDERGWLRCSVHKHYDWEYICPRKHPEGGYVLLVLVKGELLPLGAHSKNIENVVEQKVKIGDWKSDGIAWDFIEV
jgi:hypothetical protein